MNVVGRPDLSAFGDAVSRLGPTDRVVVGGYVLIGVVLIVDLIRPRYTRKPSPARLASLLATAAVSFVLAVPFAVVLGREWAMIRSLSPPGLVGWWSTHPVPAFVTCFVVVDMVAYLYHWVGHTTRVGWASHRVHHLGAEFDMGLILRQPWLPVHGLIVVPLSAFAGFSFEVAAVCSTVSLTYQAVQHTSRSWGLGRAEAVLVSGRAHRQHHLIGAGGVNLGAVFSVWDRAFGTFEPAAVPPGAVYGIGEPEPVNPLRIQADGWRRLATGPVPAGLRNSEPRAAVADRPSTKLTERLGKR